MLSPLWADAVGYVFFGRAPGPSLSIMPRRGQQRSGEGPGSGCSLLWGRQYRKLHKADGTGGPIPLPSLTRAPCSK